MQSKPINEQYIETMRHLEDAIVASADDFVESEYLKNVGEMRSIGPELITLHQTYQAVRFAYNKKFGGNK